MSRGQRSHTGRPEWTWRQASFGAARRILAAGVLALLALLPALAQPRSAAAHPLGNFTINRYSRLELAPGRLRVRYVLDMAEIPTFQAMSALDANGDRQVSDAEKNAYATRALTQIAGNLRLTLDGTSTPLRLASHEVELVPGQAGLQIMRLSAWLEANEAAAPLARAGDAGVQLDYRDDNDLERIGWREILVRTAGGIAVLGIGGTAVPTQDVADELRTYPEDMLASPLDVRQLRLAVASGASAPAAPSAGSGGAGAAPRQVGAASLSRRSDGFAEVLTRATNAPLTPPLVVFALLSAVVLGGMHSMSPGHGKTIVGAYLVGSRGTPKHALFLGLTVTLVHTAGVFALGLATLLAAQYVVPERVYPWMSLASGLLVLAMGVSLMRARWRAVSRLKPHAVNTVAHTDGHRVDGDTHEHGTHDHGFGGHAHTLPGADGAPVTWRSLLALGISGGLLPCPSALVVMLGAIALQRVAFGLLLIVAFSVGLAGTLMGVGLLMVYSGRVAGRLRLLDRLGAGRASRLAVVARVLPFGSAAVVALAGLALSVDAARQLDLPQLWASEVFRSLLPLGLVLTWAAFGVTAVVRANRARRTPAYAPADRVPVAGRTHAMAAAPMHDHDRHGHDHHRPSLGLRNTNHAHEASSGDEHPHGGNLHTHQGSHMHAPDPTLGATEALEPGRDAALREPEPARRR